MAAPLLDLYSVTAPGLERIAAAELAALGLAQVAETHGGVVCRGSIRDVYCANLWLRTSTRVLLRVATFRADSFAELERHAARVPWGRFVRARDRVRFRVTCHKSALYHSDAVAQRFGASVAAKTGCAAPGAEADDADADADAGDSAEQLFIVRIDHDTVTLSADSSGTLLHKRGYRRASAKAPMRETLAAAMLLASGWDPSQPLLDPMCGSGTIGIEAALISRNIAPGLHREFRFERWPGFDRGMWEMLRAEASSAALGVARAPIVASDRDPGAIAATRANADRAGVAGDVAVDQQPLSAAAPVGAGGGWVMVNPPYGVRIGTDVRNLYASLGSLMRGKLRGWSLGVLLASPELERQLGLPLKQLFGTTNGGIAVNFKTGAALR